MEHSTAVSSAVAGSLPSKAAPVPLTELFWNHSDTYNVGFLPLDSTALPPKLAAVEPQLQQLSALANALRSLQRVDGTFAHREAARGLLAEVERILRELPATGAFADFLRAGADRLAEGSPALISIDQVALPEDELFLVVGSLPSWDWKATQPLHSFLAGRLDTKVTASFARMDAEIGEVCDYLRELLEVPELRPLGAPRIVAAEVGLCGGEADTFPKHFGYFFAESPAVRADSSVGDVVLLLTNTYARRFEQISLPQLELLAGPLSPDMRLRTSDPRWLFHWFKGHDAGHFWTVGPDRIPALPSTEDHDNCCLHEVMADVMGYLVFCHPWSIDGQRHVEVASTVFLAEMLRYLRRDVDKFPDSRAAHIELSYLAERGAVRLDPEQGRLDWDGEAVFAGLTELARDTVLALRAGDGERYARLLARHDQGRDPQVTRFLEAAWTRSAHLAHDIAYVY